jgi:cell division protein ZapA (FtsZ GTPase activity inhibitor)
MHRYETLFIYRLLPIARVFNHKNKHLKEKKKFTSKIRPMPITAIFLNFSSQKKKKKKKF